MSLVEVLEYGGHCPIPKLFTTANQSLLHSLISRQDNNLLRPKVNREDRSIIFGELWVS